MLRNGVAPRVVARAVAELDEHFCDLEAEGLGRGLSSVEAAEFAATQLGNAQFLVEQVSQKPELRSWLFRYPRVARIVLPVAWVVLQPVRPVFAGAEHFSSIVRWSACLLLSALVTASMMLVMQLSLTLG